MSFLLAALLFLQGPFTLHITDPWGLPVPGAEVKASNSSFTTNATGDVSLPPTLPAEFELEVLKPGFERIHKNVNRWTGTQEMQLKIGSVLTGVTVTATRSERLATETPSSVTVLDSEAVRTSPSRAIDDMLRQVPGFSLLRRAGSVAAHPTSQGVSMRGVGASGASRTLVLANGIPVNDPFGTWVYWNRVPKTSIESVEVVRGGASDLYGSSAVGGVIHLRTRRPEEKTLLGDFSIGQRDLDQASLFLSDVHGKWGYSFAQEVFKTDGYLSSFNPPTTSASATAGAVDRPVASKYQTSVLSIERQTGPVRAYSNFVYSNERRKNGTPLTNNDTQFRQMSLGADITHRFGTTQIQAFGGSESFDSTFSTVTAQRASETLTSTQHVPLGYGGIQGTTLFSAGRQNFVVGMEFRHARGTSNEIQFRNGAVSGRIKNGGSQQTFAPFIEDVITVAPRVNVTWSLRWDHWRNLDLAGVKTTEFRWSPKLGATYRVSNNIGLHASAYSAFRAPTLNELYRPFSVGNAITLANPSLGDERLRGVEGGVDLQIMNGRIHGRIGGYAGRLSGTIANITLSSVGGLITRQRQNLGTARARGLETEAEFRPLRMWSITGSYLLSDSVVTKFPTQTSLEGKRIPQVPRHQFSIQNQLTLFTNYHLNVQGHGSTLLYDDDANNFPLDGFFTWDAYASRNFGSKLEVYVAGENLTDREVQVTRTAVLLGLGMPRTVRAGLNVRIGAK